MMLRKKTEVEPNVVAPETVITNTVMTHETKYSDSVVWAMFMQAAMQTWDAKTVDTIQKSAVAADAALAEYKDRFK